MERYRKLRSLGRGQSGEVWLAEREDASLVAMKQIFIGEDSTKSFEVSALEKISHPHIIQYHESFVREEFLYIITDFAEGGDLASRIRAAKAKSHHFPEQQVWKWFMQMCSALKHIHDKKIIHRDLKSQNIFLTKTGDIKIGDFGICKVLSQSEEFASTSVGTPYYISPEVCKGEPYSFKADVWSLGCIIYELCALRRPFEGESIATVLNRILYKSPESISGLYSDHLTTTVISMLQKDAYARLSISQILSQADLSPEKKEISTKLKKAYQKEISINIPPPTNDLRSQDPVSSGSPYTEAISAQNLSTRNSADFGFSESLLKYCPSSPIRPMLMGDFLKKRLGDEVFERIRRVIDNAKDPAKMLHEEPWIFSDICGEDNLSVVDAAIACGAFNTNNKPVFPSVTTFKDIKRKAFPIFYRNNSS